MLSFAGDIPGLTGVGDGDGSVFGNARVAVFADTGARRATAPLAMANELSDKPETSARAHVLMATFLGDCLGIIPSSGDWAELSATRSLEMPQRNEHSKHAPHKRGSSVGLSKVNKAKRFRTGQSFTALGPTHANTGRVTIGRKSISLLLYRHSRLFALWSGSIGGGRLG